MDKKIKPGDIIVFKKDDSKFSLLIAVLTDSDTSHAGMIYDEKTLVDLNASGFKKSDLGAKIERGAYIMRLQSELDPAPLIKTADHYLKSKIYYDFPGLFIVGGLLIFRWFTPSKKLLSLMNRVILTACYMLNEIIKYFTLDHDEEVMICSQIVYQIYHDCGEDYKIQIKNGVLYNNSANHSTRIIDLLNDSEVEEMDLMLLTDNAEDEEELMKELLDTLSEPELLSFDAEEDLDYTQVLQTAKTFISKLNILADKAHFKLPIESLFIMPCDFVYHSENLKCVGTFPINEI